MNRVATDRGTTTDLCFGTVTSVNPLIIQLDNDLSLTDNFIELSCLCKETYSDDKSVLLWKGLKLGDKVKLLKVNLGQLYYAVEKMEV